MKISDIIRQLQAIQNIEGDLPVLCLEGEIMEMFAPSLSVEDTNSPLIGECDIDDFDGVSGKFVYIGLQ